jgi:hypothetical protein
MTFPCFSLYMFLMYTVYKAVSRFLRLDGAFGTATDEIWIRKDFEGSDRG